MDRKEAADRLAKSLTEFVERAVKPGATPEEVQALPEVARVLSHLLIEYL